MSSTWLCPEPFAETAMRQMLDVANGHKRYNVVGALAYMLGNAVADVIEDIPASEQNEQASELIRELQTVIEQTVVLRLGDGIKGH